MPDDAAVAANEILFNKFAVQAAKRRALVQSWMVGATEQYSQPGEDEQSFEEEDTKLFALKPELELAGLGVDFRNLSESEKARLDPESKLEDASTAFLRERLLGKQAKSSRLAPSSRPTMTLQGVEPGFTPRRAKTSSKPGADDGSKTNNSKIPTDTRHDDEEDDEDEIGRSGLGKEKSAKKTRPDSNKKMKERKAGIPLRMEEPGSRHRSSNNAAQANAETSSGSEEETGRTKSGKSSSQPLSGGKGESKKKAVSYLDELLAHRSAKKQKTKKS